MTVLVVIVGFPLFGPPGKTAVVVEVFLNDKTNNNQTMAEENLPPPTTTYHHLPPPTTTYHHIPSPGTNDKYNVKVKKG